MRKWSQLVATFFILAISLGCSPLFKKPSDSSDPRSETKKKELEGCPLFFEKVDVCARITPRALPVRPDRESSFELVFWKRAEGSKAGPYSDPGLIPHVWLWMQMASGPHGSFPVKTTPSVDSSKQVLPGEFDVSGALFTMKGEWEIHIELRKADGGVVDAAISTIDI